MREISPEMIRTRRNPNYFQAKEEVCGSCLRAFDQGLASAYSSQKMKPLYNLLEILQAMALTICEFQRA